jgi:hypothetical protein
MGASSQRGASCHLSKMLGGMIMSVKKDDLVRNPIHNCIYDLANGRTHKIWCEVNGQVWDDVYSQVRARVYSQVREQIYSHVRRSSIEQYDRMGS